MTTILSGWKYGFWVMRHMSNRNQFNWTAWVTARPSEPQEFSRRSEALLFHAAKRSCDWLCRTPPPFGGEKRLPGTMPIRPRAMPSRLKAMCEMLSTGPYLQIEPRHSMSRFCSHAIRLFPGNILVGRYRQDLRIPPTVRQAHHVVARQGPR